MANQMRHYHLGCGERLQTGYQWQIQKKIRETIELNRAKSQKHKHENEQRV
jgi:hypothetical protein